MAIVRLDIALLRNRGTHADLHRMLTLRLTMDLAMLRICHPPQEKAVLPGLGEPLIAGTAIGSAASPARDGSGAVGQWPFSDLL